jgi:hypothetical protein
MLGGGGGQLKTGQNLSYSGDEDRQMCRLYMSMMSKMGVKLERFGDAKQALKEI